MSQKFDKKILWASVLGSTFEFFDFTVFAFCAPLISPLFFPNENPLCSLILTYGTFSIGFLSRPIGAILFGYIGDKYGRKAGLRLSIMVMGLSTVGMGFLPTYSSIGIAAPLLLTLLRIFQGMSAGGEFNGSMIFTVEHAPERKKNFYGSLVTSGCISGMLLGSLVAILVSLYKDLEWVWRVPFFLGSLILFIGYFIRKKLHETPEFKRTDTKETINSIPIKEVFQSAPKEFFSVACMAAMTGILLYSSTVFMPIFIGKTLLNSEFYFRIMSVGTLLTIILTIGLSGYLCDKHSRYRMMLVSSIAVTIVCFLNSIMKVSSPATFIVVHFIIVFVSSIYWGGMNTLIVQLFSQNYRYTGSSLSYSFGIAIFGGTAPMVSAYLSSFSNAEQLFFSYMGAAAFSGLLGVFLTRNTITPKVAFQTQTDSI